LISNGPSKTGWPMLKTAFASSAFGQNKFHHFKLFPFGRPYFQSLGNCTKMKFGEFHYFAQAMENVFLKHSRKYCTYINSRKKYLFSKKLGAIQFALHLKKNFPMFKDYINLQLFNLFSAIGIDKIRSTFGIINI
jgi:hypothetical protein